MIKRFEAVCSCSEPDMRESEFSDYVSFDDHIATIAAKDAEIAKLREALNQCADHIDSYYFEGDKEYQVVIVARAALAKAGEA